MKVVIEIDPNIYNKTEKYCDLVDENLNEFITRSLNEYLLMILNSVKERN
jgi:hypothetical protein